MKNQILNLGKVLNMVELKQVSGGTPKGFAPPCENASGNSCDPYNGGGTLHGNSTCNLGEICTTGGFCACPN